MKIRILLFFNILQIFIQYQNKSKSKINEKNSRKLDKKEDIQKLNKIIHLFSPFNKVSYISSITSKNDDLFISLNTEEKEGKRVIYAIKSDGSNFFSDIDKPYKIFTLSDNNYNIYPILALLIKNEKQYLVEITFDSMFELYDYYNNVVYSQGIFQIIGQNSRIYKNTFISLDYYDNTDYILNAYVEKKNNYFLLQKLYFRQVDISNRQIDCQQNQVEESSKQSQVSCFELLNIVQCLYVNEFKSYIIGIFNLSNLNLIFEEDLIDSIRTHEIFSKNIHFKDNISAAIYFLTNNNQPFLIFKNLDIIEKKLDDYIEKITINKDNKYELNGFYIYNDIIKINENSIYYINTKNETDKIMVIMFKFFNNSKSILINYYKINLSKYNIRIYKDLAIFKYNELLGIGITHYNYSLSNDNKTYGSYFIIGRMSAANISISEKNDIFNNDKNFTLKISDYINIENNIFGYVIKEIIILSDLNRDILGFHLHSNELKKIIKTNEILSSNDKISFILNSELGVKLGNYILEYKVLITDSNYEDFFSFPDSYEFYANDELSLESLYQPQVLASKNAYIHLEINYCYKTCKKCSYLGDEENHHCITCSEEYPFPLLKNYSGIDHGINCVKTCPKNFTLKYNMCVKKENSDSWGYSNLSYFDELIGYEIYNNAKSSIKFLSDNKVIIKNISSLLIYAYEIGEDRENFCLENNLIYIDLVDSKKEILNIYGLDNDTDIYLLMVEFPSHYKNALTDDFDFALVFENGTELNLSLINRDILVNITAPITDLELAHYDYAVEFYKQGYDIYNIDSILYHDFCITAYFKGNDITLEDRRKEVFPNNMTIIKPYCKYKMVDLINKTFTCEYNISDSFRLNENETRNFNNNFFPEEESKDNFLNYLVSHINYKIFTCYELFMNIENYKLNLGVYFSTTISFLIIFLIIFHFAHGLPKFQKLMYNEIPTFQKLQELIKRKKSLKNIYNENPKIFATNPVKRNIRNCEKEEKTIPDKSEDILQSNSSSQKNNNAIKKFHSSNAIFNLNKNNIFRRKDKAFISFYKNRIKKSNDILRRSDYFKSNLQKEDKKIIISKNIYKYDDLPLKDALRYDKRNIFQLFKNKMMEKLELIDIIVSKQIKELLLSKYLLFIQIDLTLNALFYSDKVVSHKSHNNGKLDSFVIFTLTLTSNLISLLIDHYLSFLTKSEEIIEKIKEIKKEYIFLKVCKNFIKIITIQAIIFFSISIISIIICFYYLVIFCKIYKKSQISLLTNYIISFLEGFVIKIIIIIIIVACRKFGLCYKNKYIYNTSKFFDRYI